MTQIIGIAGAGNQGTALALKLAKAGCQVVVLPPRSGMPQALAGFETAPSAEALAARADAVLTCLRNGAETAALLPGLLAGAKGKSGFIQIDHGNGDPAQAREAAALWQAQDQFYTDAPMLGPPEVIATSPVRLLAGGTEASIARLLDVTTPYRRDHVHAGAAGQGHFLRMMLNQLGYTMVALSAEVIATARAGGLAPETLRDAAAGMGLDSGTFQTLLASAIDTSIPHRPLSLDYMRTQLGNLASGLPGDAPSDQLLTAALSFFDAAAGGEGDQIMATALPARLAQAPLRPAGGAS